MKEFRAIPETNEEGLWSIVGQLLHEIRSNTQHLVPAYLYADLHACLPYAGGLCHGRLQLHVSTFRGVESCNEDSPAEQATQTQEVRTLNTTHPIVPV